MTTIPARMRKMAGVLGIPFRLSQKRGGVQIMAMNTDRINGTRMALAAFMPATTTTKLAIMNRNLAPLVNSA
jgi:hypothetical protein